MPGERYANAQQMADDLRRYLGHEPIAARPDAVAYQLGKFVQRHRVGVAAGAVVSVALVVGIGVALWEANEARRQRLQAEGLIEFMLGDLRKKLQPVGRLDVLDAVGEKALEYYAAQDAGQLDAASLGRRARALHLIGEMAETRGNLAEAQQVFRQAAETTAELVARSPQDGQRIFDHAQSVYWVGYAGARRGQMQDAEASFQQYLVLANRLLALDGTSVDWRIERLFAELNLGVIYLETGRYAQALQALDNTRKGWTGVIGARPEMRAELANTWGWISKARAGLGEFSNAIQAQQAKIDLLRNGPEFDKNRNMQRLAANAHYEISQFQLCLGLYEAAIMSAREAVAQGEVLAAVDGSNTLLLAHDVFARLSLAEGEMALGRLDGANIAVDRIWPNALRVGAAGADTNKWQIPLQGRLLVLAAQLALAGRREAPTSDLQAYVDKVHAQLASGKQLDAEELRVLSAVELALGDVLAREGHAEAATQPWRAAAQRLQPLAASGDIRLTTLLAHVQSRLGDLQAARVFAGTIETSSYRHPAYADLRQRLALPRGAASAR